MKLSISLCVCWLPQFHPDSAVDRWLRSTHLLCNNLRFILLWLISLSNTHQCISWFLGMPRPWVLCPHSGTLEGHFCLISSVNHCHSTSNINYQLQVATREPHFSMVSLKDRSLEYLEITDLQLSESTVLTAVMTTATAIITENPVWA